MLIYHDVWIGIAILLLFVGVSQLQYFCDVLTTMGSCH